MILTHIVTRDVLDVGRTRGSGEQKSPSGSRGGAPSRGLEAKLPEAGDIF